MMFIRQRLDEKIPAPHYDEVKYKKELEDLKALQVRCVRKNLLLDNSFAFSCQKN